MRNNAILLIGAVLGALATGCGPSGAESEQLAAAGSEEAVAVAAATAWLELVDAGDYGQSWDRAAALFKKAVTREQWVQSLSAIREPLGSLVSREVLSKQHLTELPGAPDGDYVVIQFETSFENKKQAVETVTPMLDGDTWKVSGFFIK